MILVLTLIIIVMALWVRVSSKEFKRLDNRIDIVEDQISICSNKIEANSDTLHHHLEEIKVITEKVLDLKAKVTKKRRKEYLERKNKNARRCQSKTKS